MIPLYPDPLTQYNSPFTLCVKSLPIQYDTYTDFHIPGLSHCIFCIILVKPLQSRHTVHLFVYSLQSLHKILSNISNVLLVILGFLYTPRPSHPKPYTMHPHPNYIQLYPHYLYQMTSNINSTHQATKCLNDLNIYQCPVEIDALSFCLMFLTILDTSISWILM